MFEQHGRTEDVGNVLFLVDDLLNGWQEDVVVVVVEIYLVTFLILETTVGVESVIQIGIVVENVLKADFVDGLVDAEYT